MSDLDRITLKHKSLYGAPDLVVHSPGRANIIGEHIDYLGGVVLPFAINRGLWFSFSKNNLKALRFYAADLDESFELKKLGGFNVSGPSWFNYLRFFLKGFPPSFGVDVTFGGNLPIGAGLSASSALTCGYIFGMNEIMGWNLNPSEIIQLASSSENQTGVDGGMMDQHAIVLSKKDHALLLDCQDNSVKHIKLDLGDYDLVLFNSGIQHKLIESGYNHTRINTEQGLSKLNAVGSFSHFRELNSDFINTTLNLTPLERSSCLYAIEENQRVFKIVAHLENGDVEKIGPLLNAGHWGLSKMLLVSCEEVDYLVKIAEGHQSILGSRMVGGGFGGCTINLVKKGADISGLKEMYQSKYGDCDCIYLSAENGVHIIG